MSLAILLDVRFLTFVFLTLFLVESDLASSNQDPDSISPSERIARTRACFTSLKPAAEALETTRLNWRRVAEKIVSPNSPLIKWRDIVDELGPSPLSLIDQWNFGTSDKRQAIWIAHDLFGNPWLIEEPSERTNIWKDLTPPERIALVRYLAHILGHETQSSIILVPPFRDLKPQIAGIEAFRDSHSSIVSQDRSAFDPLHFFYQAQHDYAIRGAVVPNSDGTFTQWDPLPYALAAVLYKFGAPASSLIIRSGSSYASSARSGSTTQVLRSPEKFWLEVEIEDFLPALLVSPSLVADMSLQDQNSIYEREGAFGWKLRTEGMLSQHLKHQVRVQTNFLERPAVGP